VTKHGDNDGKSPNVAGLLIEATRCNKEGRFDDAKQLCEQVLAYIPDQSDALHLSGVLAHKSGDSLRATKLISQALQINPDLPNGWFNLARCYRDTNDEEGAFRALKTASIKTPDNPAIKFELGKLLSETGKLDEAEMWLKNCLQLDQHSVMSHIELGILQMKLKRWTAAEQHFETALRIDPTIVVAHTNLALVRENQGRYDEVLGHYEAAIEHRPGHAEARFQRALALLSRENFRSGWKEHVWRFKSQTTETSDKRFELPYWCGEPLEGKHILVWTEQGPGDEILLASMLPDILSRGARCTLLCSPRMIPIFQRSFPDLDNVLPLNAIPKDLEYKELTYQASLSHLGLQLRDAEKNFPHHEGYLRANSEVTERLRTKYKGRGNKKLVGISWKSSNISASAEKSTDPVLWRKILNVQNVIFVSLQYGACPEEISTMKRRFGVDIISDISIDPLSDMDLFTAQVAAMDLVISVSNTSVHVAGALNIPVWILIPSGTGRIWYWFLNRTDSLWYPSARLYRQPNPKNWKPAFNSVATDFAEWAAQ